jgi:hypothetical protein
MQTSITAYMRGPGARFQAYMDGPSVVPGLTGMDVIDGTKGTGLTPWKDADGEDERLNNPELHARVAHWLQSGMTQKQLKQKVADEGGMEISGNKKVLALRLALKGLPSAMPSPVFSSGGKKPQDRVLERDVSDGAKLDAKFNAVAGPSPSDAKVGRDPGKVQQPASTAAPAAPHTAAAASGVKLQTFNVWDAAEDQEHEDHDMWEDGWVPRTAGGKQKSCNVIRGEISRFLARGTMTQTAFLQAVSCNSKSYGSFMKLKGAWNGTQNGVYWGAARFFEIEKRRVAREKKSAAGKRKHAELAASRKQAKQEGGQLLAQLAKVDVPDGAPVFDTCAEVRRKIRAFLKVSGVTQSAFLKHIGVAPNSFNSFMKQTGRADPQCIANMQPGAANHVYPKAYRFFEQKRLLEKKPKSAARLSNETMLAANKEKMAALWGGNTELAAKYVTEGFALRHDDGKRIVFGR